MEYEALLHYQRDSHCSIRPRLIGVSVAVCKNWIIQDHSLAWIVIS